MAAFGHAMGHRGGSGRITDDQLHPNDQASLERDRFTPSPVAQESIASSPQYEEVAYGDHHDNYHEAVGTSNEYQPVATTTFASSHRSTFSARKPPALVSRVFQGWWKEILWCIVSIACIPALVGMLRRFEDQPLPDWPHGITLNTAVAFISTLCRTAFLLPVVEALSQLKWNWYRKPRPLQDFRVFDEASRGPWGSLKLLFTTKGRGMGVLAALILVSSIATSTLTQSAVTYPTRMVAVPGNGTATSTRSTEYFWVTANTNAIRDLMMPFTLAVPQALYTRPETQLLYTTPTCRTSECRWEIFTSLAVCLDMKNVTDQLDIHGDEVYTDISGPNGGSNITLPNGAMLHPTYGYRNSNISVATSGMPSLSLNETGNMIGTVPILGYTMIYYPPLRAYEMLLHFCVNTYNVSVTNNIATVTQVASYTNADYGEAFVARYNTTYNVTYLTTPDNPGFKYVAAGYGPSEIGSSLATSIGGAYSYLGGYNMSAGTAVFGTALERAEAGITSNDSQAVDDVRYAAIYNLSSNIAMGLTNALTEWSGEPAVNGTALIQQTFVSIRWEWITLLIIQVALSIIVLIVAISHTEIIGIPVIKGNPLPGLFAIGAQERYAVEQEQMGVKASGETPWKSEHVLDGDFKRFGNKWALGSLGYQREESRRVETVYVGEPGKWPA